jgi:hypothetical protein
MYFFDVAIHIFSMLLYIFFDVALHIFAMFVGELGVAGDRGRGRGREQE